MSRSKGKIRRDTGSPAPSASKVSQKNQPLPAKGQTPERWLSAAICLFLASVVWIVFGQTLHHDFVNFDDSYCVYQNPMVLHGLTRNGFIYAFTQSFNSNWIPLTALSDMLDCQLYGPHPWGHHLTSVILHSATAILLFLFLQNLTKATWRSAFVATVFAIHPLRVESVAWIAERKDVLSGLFFVLTLGAYVRYARQERLENASALTCFCSPFYWLALLLFALGLMSKPMLVTLPFVLLLLDYWPLNRVSRGATAVSCSLIRAWGNLLLEKIPFLLLTIAACGIAVLTQSNANAMSFGHDIHFPARIANAVTAYATYLWQMVYPAGLAVFYPYPTGHLPVWMVALSVMVLLLISASVVKERQKHPYLLMGWLWYLGMLVPVIGLVQVGGQARADRYTYLPQIGLYLMVAWGAAELIKKWHLRRIVPGLGAAGIIAALLVAARIQTMYWKDSMTLWTRAFGCTADNAMTEDSLGQALSELGKFDEAVQHYKQALKLSPEYADIRFNLGSALAAEGNVDEAIQSYEQALRLNPNYVEAQNNLGIALVREGKFAEAMPLYERALQLKPNYAVTHNNFGDALAREGKMAQSIQEFQRALQLNPDFADAHYNYGNELVHEGRAIEAIQHYERALQLKPDDAHIHNNLGIALAGQRKLDEAIQHYKRATQIKPDYAEAYNNLGITLADQGKLTEAVQQFEHALQLNPNDANARYNLAHMLADQGKQAEAIDQLQQALNLATAQNQTALADTIRERLKSLQVNLPQAPAR